MWRNAGISWRPEWSPQFVFTLTIIAIHRQIVKNNKTVIVNELDMWYNSVDKRFHNIIGALSQKGRL